MGVGGSINVACVTEASIKDDVESIRTHSWYKLQHAVPAILYFNSGEQEDDDPPGERRDPTGMHLHLTLMHPLTQTFIDTLPAACRRHPVVIDKDFYTSPYRAPEQGEIPPQVKENQELMTQRLVAAGIAIARELGLLLPEETVRSPSSSVPVQQ